MKVIIYSIPTINGLIAMEDEKDYSFISNKSWEFYLKEIKFRFKDNQKSSFLIKRFVDTKVFIFGLGLFAGEGTKKAFDRNGLVELINNDPKLILAFIDFDFYWYPKK